MVKNSRNCSPFFHHFRLHKCCFAYIWLKLKISFYSIPLTEFKRISSIHGYCCKSQSWEKSLRPRLVSPLAAVWPRPPPHLTVISVIYILQPEKCIFLARRRGSGDITIIWSELGINANDGNKQSPLYPFLVSHTWCHCHISDPLELDLFRNRKCCFPT